MKQTPPPSSSRVIIGLFVFGAFLMFSFVSTVFFDFMLVDFKENRNLEANFFYAVNQTRKMLNNQMEFDELVMCVERSHVNLALFISVYSLSSNPFISFVFSQIINFDDSLFLYTKNSRNRKTIGSFLLSIMFSSALNYHSSPLMIFLFLIYGFGFSGISFVYNQSAAPLFIFIVHMLRWLFYPTKPLYFNQVYTKIGLFTLQSVLAYILIMYFTKIDGSGMFFPSHIKLNDFVSNYPFENENSLQYILCNDKFFIFFLLGYIMGFITQPSFISLRLVTLALPSLFLDHGFFEKAIITNLVDFKLILLFAGAIQISYIPSFIYAEVYSCALLLIAAAQRFLTHFS